MDPSHLAHVLGEEEKRQFDEQGYLIVKGILPPELTAAARAAIEERELNPEVGPTGRKGLGDLGAEAVMTDLVNKSWMLRNK